MSGSQQGMSRTDLGDGSSVLTMPYDEGLMQKSISSRMEDKTSTPSPDSSRAGSASDRGGPIVRFNDSFTELGSTYLEAMGLEGFEAAKAIQKRRNELFRNEFPLVMPRFRRKCTECEAEYDAAVGECDNCGASGDELREPDKSERREAERLFEKVNKEGQSLRGVMKDGEDDHARVGVAALVIRYDYVVASGTATALGEPIMERGEVIRREPSEILRADPKRVVPVTDGDGRLGGWKWTCPIHRDDPVSDSERASGHTECAECGTELQEVCYVEKKHVRSGAAQIEEYFFDHEIVDWAFFYPRHHGLDGLSPMHHIWVKQAILHWMDVYAGAFYDPDSDNYPNKFMVVHTTNADAWERNFEKAEDEAQENLYANQIFVNEYATDSKSTPDLQVVDMMDDELLGQNEQIKKSYKSDIRTQFGVTDVFDSELSDSGGLNNEGLQLEVTDRHIASAQYDMMTGPLDELMKRLNFDDYRISFVPSPDSDLDTVEQRISVGGDAVDAGLEARLEDGELEVDDGEFEEGDEEGGMGALFGAEGDPPDDVDEGLVEAAGAADGVGTFRIEAGADDDRFEGGETMAWGAEFPNSGVYVDWNVDAWPEGESLGGPHVSEYDSMEDAAAVAEGRIVADGGIASAGSDGAGGPVADLDDDLLQAAEDLHDGYEHLVWADETSKADPFWDSDDGVPERILELIERAIDRGAVFGEFEDLDVPDEVAEFLEEELRRPEGWSLESLTNDFAERFDLDPGAAEPVVRTETASVLNTATEEAYEDLGVADEPVFEWVGPRDHRTTDACEWLKQRTEGGVTMAELVDLEREAQERFFPDLDEFRRHVVHPNERHTFRESFETKAAGAAGPIEVEVETVPGGIAVRDDRAPA